MKRFLLCFCIFIFLFSGCGTGKRESKYPCIEYRASEYNYDKDNDIIYIPNGLEIDEFSPYEWEENEGDYDLILHFKKGVKE